jgi:hypothetical protein
MPKTRTEARHQHHVPCMLQRPWAVPGKGRRDLVQVLDKHEDRIFRTAVENVLGERDFNTFEEDGVVICLEDGMGKIETEAAPIIRKLIAERQLSLLSDAERSVIVVFTALQKIRGISMRAQMLDIDAQMRALLRANGDDPTAVPQLQGSDDPEQVKLTALMLIRKNLGDFSQSLASKALILMEAPEGKSFLLGDTPVVWANSNDTAPYGNLGLECIGIELYLPLAPDLAIGFWCPTLVEFLKSALGQCESSLRNTAAVGLLGVGPEADSLREMRRELTARAGRIRGDLSAIHGGTPISYSSENMDYVNSLQVAQAERHIISADGDFSLVRRMISENPRFRQGARSMVN